LLVFEYVFANWNLLQILEHLKHIISKEFKLMHIGIAFGLSNNG